MKATVFVKSVLLIYTFCTPLILKLCNPVSVVVLYSRPFVPIIDGVQKVYINNTDLTNTVAFNQVGDATFHGNINVTGTVTANAFIGTSSNGVGAIVYASSYFPSTVLSQNHVYRLNYITLSAGTWIVTSQVQMFTGISSMSIDASVSLSNTNGSMVNSNITTQSTTTPLCPSLQNTLFYVTSTSTTIHCNFTYNATYACTLDTSGCFLKAMRIA